MSDLQFQLNIEFQNFGKFVIKQICASELHYQEIFCWFS